MTFCLPRTWDGGNQQNPGCRAGILKNRDVNAFRHRGGWIQRGSWKRAVQPNLVITCGEYQLDGVYAYGHSMTYNIVSDIRRERYRTSPLLHVFGSGVSCGT
ncbi:hypothetical protein TWF173_000795 [Orbilia oligospora]|nr:hypothetical protein TWF173_000795 [Orbilia oligospora]